MSRMENHLPRKSIRPFGVLAVTLAVTVAPAVSPALAKQHRKPTKIAIKGFTVGFLQSDGTIVKRNARIGSTVTHCASVQVRELIAHLKVRNARRNGVFEEIWKVGGSQHYIFHKKWLRGGRFGDAEEIYSDAGLRDGRWKLKLTAGGRTLDRAGLVVAADNSC